MEGYGLKNYAGDNFGVIVNICSLVVTVITIFMTPLFDKNVINTTLTYVSVIPLTSSIIFNKLVKKTNSVQQDGENYEEVVNAIIDNRNFNSEEI
jgi:hypothetical protein